MKNIKEEILKEFKSRFETEPKLYASAGRINLIGEHTDYNGGFVFPGAIDKVIMAAIAPNDTDKVKVYSIDIDEEVEFGLNEEDAPTSSWARYIFGVCREILKRGGTVKGFDAVFAGNIPLGAGLSSSAALESCFAFALNDLFNDNTIDKFELAKIGQATEHNYCGVNCGIMDQFASAEPLHFPPLLSISAFASSLVMVGSVPVKTNFKPSSFLPFSLTVKLILSPYSFKRSIRAIL